MVLLAAFQFLLSRYAGTDDVVVGSPVAGRGERAVEGLIGFFANTLVLRTDLSGDPTFRALLGRVREVALGAWEHQDVPFEKLVKELQPERSLRHAALFQVELGVQSAEPADVALAGLRTARVGVALDTAQVDLALHLSARGGGLHGEMAYSTDLFDRATVQRMAGHLERVLEQVAHDADLPLSRMSLLSDAERRQVVEGWNRTDAAYPAEATLHGLFEAQAARTPDAVALVFEGGALPYAALNARANRLAHFLRRRGVGPETRVGICLERGPELVVALLAVLKAGGAYVPLDPGLPADRLAYMVDDAAVPVLLTRGAPRGLPPERPGTAVVCLDARRAEIDAGPADNPAGGAAPSALAYVIYTSGSTGRPKGVMNAHGGVVNRLCWMQAEYGIGADDAVLLKTPFSFDVSVWELFWPLLAGARLVVARPDGHRDPEYLRAVIEREGVTTVHFVPSMLEPFVETARPGRCAGLRRVICSGEALSPALVERFHARFPAPATLHNLYGPTEAAVDVTYWACPRGPLEGVPIGRPVWNTRLYVLDSALHPTPVGIPGELYIGGVQVARGYLGRPALTAERFVADPFSPAPGARLYRTGDRVRRRADGVMEYLGRLDDQVKIRGFRIEPGEIEAALREHGDVRQCAVVPREDAPGEKRLVAYVVGGADADSLREHLRRTLPEYMVPAAFVPLDALPLTPSGKLDRGALPAPARAAAGDRYVAPRTPVEAALAAVWAEVLRMDRVGVEDGFFALGGDSILSIQVVSRARRAGVEVTPRQMFEHQTIAALAAAAAHGRVAGAPRAEQGRVEGPAPLTPIQAWFFEQAQPEPGHFNQSVLLEVHPSVDGAALEAALAAVLEHHDALRLRFRRTASGWEQWHAREVGIGLERVDLSALDGDAGDRAQEGIAGARQASLHLERGPLGRAVLFDRGGGRRVLLLVLHHLVTDGVSWRILRDDLEGACARAAAGRSPSRARRARRTGRGRRRWRHTPPAPRRRPRRRTGRLRGPAAWRRCRGTARASAPWAARGRSPCGWRPARRARCCGRCRRRTARASTTCSSAPWRMPWAGGRGARACAWPWRATGARRRWARGWTSRAPPAGSPACTRWSWTPRAPPAPASG